MDELKAYLKTLADDAAREAFAVSCGTTLGHMRNASYGLRKLAPETCVKVEQHSKGRVRRWHLRNDWAAIWPELIGASDAPICAAAA